jgi:glucosylceramidase
MKKNITLFLVCSLIVLAGLNSAFSCKKTVPDPGDGDGDTTAVTKKSDVSYWVTDQGKGLMLKMMEIQLLFGANQAEYPTIDIDTSQTFQSVDGFGGTLTGGSAWLINRLPADKRDKLIRELFSTDSTAIGISYLRISIGASDLDATTFSYNDMPAGQTDTSLTHFSLGPDRQDLIPVLKQALTHNPAIKIMGSPWSAPVWMKSNRSTVGGRLLTQYYNVYARYLVKYIQGMQAEGIPIDAITIQNEPLNPNNNPSMEMQWAEQAAFIKTSLGPAFRAAGITTKIILYDHNCDHPEYPINILNDPDAAQYVDGSAFHLYGGDISALSQVHQAWPLKNLYFTEQWIGGPSNFSGDLRWHVRNLTIGAMRNWSRNVLEWNLASDPTYRPHTDGGCTTCEGAVTIGTDITRNVMYYIIGHGSKFVRPGSVRIGSSTVPKLPNVAFIRPDGKKVLILLNDSEVDQTFNIRYKGKSVTTNLGAGAVATFVW